MAMEHRNEDYSPKHHQSNFTTLKKDANPHETCPTSYQSILASSLDDALDA